MLSLASLSSPEKDFFAAEPYRAEFEEAYLRDSNAILEKMKRLAHSILVCPCFCAFSLFFFYHIEF